MQVPSILQGELLSRLLQGAAAGAVASIVIGFSGRLDDCSTAKNNSRLSGLIPPSCSFMPVCAEKFLQNSDAQANLAVIKKIPSSGNRANTCRRAAGRHSRGLPPPTITWLGRVQRS